MPEGSLYNKAVYAEDLATPNPNEDVIAPTPTRIPPTVTPTLGVSKGQSGGEQYHRRPVFLPGGGVATVTPTPQPAP